MSKGEGRGGGRFRVSWRSIELQPPGASAGAGSMISRKSKALQSSEVVDDITTVKICAITGVDRIRQKRKDMEPSDPERWGARTARVPLRDWRAGRSLWCVHCIGKKIRRPCGRLWFHSIPRVDFSHSHGVQTFARPAGASFRILLIHLPAWFF